MSGKTQEVSNKTHLPHKPVCCSFARVIFAMVIFAMAIFAGTVNDSDLDSVTLKAYKVRDCGQYLLGSDNCI